MSRLHSFTPALVDGVDVVQLLHGIGEASASTDSVQLFGLCLSAQRVLDQVQAGSASAITSDEAAMLATYRALNTDGRSRLVSLAKRLQKWFARQRPGLSLVHSNLQQRGGAQ